MSFSEILQSFKDSLSQGWDSIVFFGKTYKKISVIALLVFGVSFVWWARSGFTFDLFRSQAADEQTGDGGTGGAGGGGAGTGGGAAAATTTKSANWSYCDYATNSCQSAPTSLVQEARDALGVPLTDYTAVSCATPGAACVPGVAPDTCRPWQGSNETSWRPLDTPANVPACEPLSRISNTQFPGFTDPMPIPPPITFPDCFSITDKSSADPNWGTVTENTVPLILQDNPNAKLFLGASIVNNCPWTVHYNFQVAGSFKASFGQGTGGRTIAISPTESGKAFVTNMPSGFDFPSCWNSGGARPADCAREIKIEFKLNTYTCGSIGISSSWWHRVQGNATGGASAKATTSGPLNYASVINYGRDCVGSPIERAPGGGGGTGGTAGTCPVIPQQSLVRPAVLSVQCGASQNIITWQDPRTLNAAVNTVLRNTGTANAVSLWSEGGCWNTFGIRTFTDRNIIAGTTYTYRVKTHPNITSNAVACRSGVQVSPNPTPSSSATPVPTGSVNPIVTVIPPTITPFITVNPTDTDLDGDGIPNSVECPGYVTGASTAGCPDSDGDGTPDILDTDSNDDGISDGPLGGAGAVPTGPGDTTLLALIISAIVSLAYVSYTHSPGAKRHEAESISKDQGPMDFRS